MGTLKHSDDHPTANADSQLTAPCQRYTPAMLAELLNISVRTVRRWQRAGVLKPVDIVMQLPYFDYSGLATARQLARWMQQGASVLSIQKQLDALCSRAGNDVESIEKLPIIADGKRLVLRQGDQFLEASGQFRFGFDDNAALDDLDEAVTLQFQPAHDQRQRKNAACAGSNEGHLSLEAIVDAALAAEDDLDIDAAMEWYRAALSAYGPNADICFQLAELLYRDGDLQGARERYFVALEINPELVEARANLGCVLAEAGQFELAIAAFEGALQQYEDYADVHFHLARVLDDQGDSMRAQQHWQRFLELAPASPWAEEAQARLSQSAPMFDF